MALQTISSSQGNKAIQLVTYYIRFPDGRVVARTKEELVAVPQTVPSSIIGQTQKAVLNPNPIGGVPAVGPNVGKVPAIEKTVGYVSTAQALATGNPGLPQPGSLQYADYKARGLL